MGDTEDRDGPCEQHTGAVWPRLWIAEGRGRGLDKVIASMVPILEKLEEPQYQWAWVQPYLDQETALDEYRAQQAGKYILFSMASGKLVMSSEFWMRETKKEAEGADESWLLLDGTLAFDGWKKIQVKAKNGLMVWIWTKKT